MKQIPLNEIEVFFEEYEFGDSPIELSQGEISLDLKKTVETHITALKANPKNERLMPFYNRLLLMYNLAKE